MDESKVPDEVAYDPYKLLLYKRAIRKGKERENTLRINIIGNYAQGKTSLANRLTGKTCDGVTSTNGIEINRYKCQTSDDGTHSLAPFENENQEFVNRVATVARSIEQAIRLDRGESNDYSQQNTLKKETAQDLAQLLETKPHVSTKDVASKVDDVENFVHPEAKIPEAKEKKIMSISSEEMATFSNVVEIQKEKPAKFIDIWDFGGQYIFYATHTLFHSRKALYLLVFDLTKSLDTVVLDEEFPGETGDRNMEYFARFWMESIHAYAGPDTKVILVGTHKDKLQGNDRRRNEYFEKIRCLFDDSELINHIQKEDFAVNNHDFSDPGIADLLAFIMRKHEEQVQPVEIPARWIQLEKALRAMKRPIITFQDVIELDKHNEYPLFDEEQLKLFLHYHHEKGSLFFYDEGELSDFICLCPKFLIDAFKCIITSEQFYKNDPDIRSLWKALSKEGRLDHHLIDKVWSNKPDFMKHKDAILGFLRKQNIISEIVEHNTNSEEKKHGDWFIVPSLLKGSSSRKELTRFLAGKSQSQVRYSMKFCKSSVVHLSFHRVLAAALGTWPVVTCGTERLLCENVCVFSINRKHAGLLEQRTDSGTIELRVINLQSKQVESHHADGFRRFVESVVIHEFRRLKYHKEENDKPFVPAYRCNHTDHGPEGGSQLADFREGEDIMCPDNITHESFDYKRAHEEWFPRYTDEVYPKIRLSNKTLSRLAQTAIGTNWSLLGPHLRVKKVEIDHIEEQHGHIEMKIFSMLLKWKDKLKDKATLDVLVEAMKKCPGVNIYWDEFRNIKDEYLRKQDSQEIDFIQPLSNKIVKVNKTLNLECEITKSNALVMWLKDGEPIRQDGRITIFSDGRFHKLVVDNVTVEDAAKYKCTYGTSVTECFVKIEDPNGSLKFITELTDIEVGDIHNTVTFLCELNKSQTGVEWYFRSQRLHPSSKYAIIDDGSTHMLKINDVSESDEGMYSALTNGLRSEATLYIEETEEEKELLAQHRDIQRGRFTHLPNGRPTNSIDSGASIGNIAVSVVKGDISEQEVDVIVNSVDRDLDLGHGKISASLLKTAGKGLQEELCIKYQDGLQYGEIAVTSGHKLKCDIVLYSLTNSWEGNNATICKKAIHKLVTTCMNLAERRNKNSIAFPAVGTGDLGYPRDIVASEMFKAVSDFAESNTTSCVKDVRFIVYPMDLENIQAFEDEVRKWTRVKHVRGKCIRDFGTYEDLQGGEGKAHEDSEYLESWYFGPLSREDTNKILENVRRNGVFLVRESQSVKGDLVLCVREDCEIRHYLINRVLAGGSVMFRIGDTGFPDIPTLLNYYKTHCLDATTLTCPAPIEKVIAKYDFPGKDPEDLPFKKGEILVIISKDEENWWRAKNNDGRTGQVPVPYVNIIKPTPIIPKKLPTKAVVIQTRIPNLYDKTQLRLNEDDIVTVTQINANGQWKGEINGKAGYFPYTHIKFLDDW